jgi:hypothetical protein
MKNHEFQFPSLEDESCELKLNSIYTKSMQNRPNNTKVAKYVAEQPNLSEKAKKTLKSTSGEIIMEIRKYF